MTAIHPHCDGIASNGLSGSGTRAGFAAAQVIDNLIGFFGERAGAVDDYGGAVQLVREALEQVSAEMPTTPLADAGLAYLTVWDAGYKEATEE